MEAAAVLSKLSQALAGRYRVEREIGRGGMATVFLAHDLKHDRDVAIKVLRPEHAATIAASRFLHEVRLTARLTHPNVVSLHDSGEAEGLLYYVMPFVAGESLRERLEREGQLPIADAVGIAREIAEGLVHAHAQGIVHRDLKPENILLSQGHALLTDFGIAHAAVEAGTGPLTSSGTFVGTPVYASPEQVSGKHHIDARTDLYSLACVLYEMLAGEPPFTGASAQALLAKHALDPRPSVRVLRDTVPRAIDDAIRRAMARVPADRFASVAEFARALEHGTVPETPPLAGVRVRRRWWLDAAGMGRRWWLAAAARDHRRWWPLVAVASVGVIAVGAVALLLTHPDGRYREPPTWSPWTDLSGEVFSVIAGTDSLLLVHSFGGDSLYAHDGRGWAGFHVPEPFVLRHLEGSITRPRLLAAPEPARRGQGARYSWLELAPGALREAERLPAMPPGHTLGDGWTDGRETVVWLAGLERLVAGRWTRESTRTAGWIPMLWGKDFKHRQALVSSAPDSILFYDGISWRMADILPRPSALVPAYSFGASLDDGTSIVLGEACDSAACEPLIMQQDPGGAGEWRRVRPTEGLGLPLRQPLRTPGACDVAYFALTGGAGHNRNDYYVWGDWVRCAPVSRSEFSDCPREWPCTWHVANGRLEPVDEFRGMALKAVQPAGRKMFALAADGMLWQLVGRSWRPVDQVPGMLERRAAASGHVLVRSTGGRATYEWGGLESVPRLTRRPLQLGELARSGIASVVVHDSTIAILTGDGTVLRSVCTLTDPVTGERALACPAAVALSGRGAARAIGLLPGGAVLAVGPAQATRLQGGSTFRENIPRTAFRDTLWGVHVASDGNATILGNHVLLQRAIDGVWTVVRDFPAGVPASGQFAVLSTGDVAIGADVLRVWPRTGSGPPSGVLRRTTFGEPALSALHVLPDGRLVAGFAAPQTPGIGGSIEIWALPTRGGRSQRVPLPYNVGVTGLADDGRNLIVTGRGGTMAIPLSSLPFAVPGQSPEPQHP